MLDFIIYSFWISLIIISYTYIGYAVLLFLLVKIKSVFTKKVSFQTNYLPDVTFIVVAYNEEQHIREKIDNSISLRYPKDKIQLIFITDGSDDNTPEIIKEFPEIELMHLPERKGKIDAMNRAMRQVKGEIVIFTDANTYLNKEAVINIICHFENQHIGVVSSEKRILVKGSEVAVGAGEGIYWKYESMLKKWDSELSSVMGAAGELLAIRKNLYEKIPEDTLIEDFYLSFKIIENGYKIAYEPDAYALEEPSISLKEELKRKIRIAAGGIQAIVRLKKLLNPFKFGIITFQYISHRVLRWTLTPLLLPVLFLSNLLLWNFGNIYQLLFIGQFFFYMLAFVGYLFERKQIRLKLLFVPFYFCMMNYAVYIGFLRYLRGSQSVLWEKSERRKS